MIFLKNKKCIILIIIFFLSFSYLFYIQTQKYKIETEKLLKNYHQEIIENIEDLNIREIKIKYNETILNINENYKTNMKKKFFLYLFLTSSVLITYLYFEFKVKMRLKQIDKYIEDIINNKDTFDIREYENDSLSILKDDIYKITKLLKEEKEISKYEKQYLETILSDISHQIKTPLTSMYVINDLLLMTKVDSDKGKEFLNKNRQQLERIEWLVTSLLKISRLDSGVVTLNKENISVDELIEKAIFSLKILIELKNQNLIINKSETSINVDINWTVEALLNIIKNACEHTKDTIIISSNDNPLYVEIIIEDNGTGIKKEDMKNIFKRFFKSENKESIGIGLNMAKTIIEKQNGTIEVISEINKYTKFIIKFYKT